MDDQRHSVAGEIILALGEGADHVFHFLTGPAAAVRKADPQLVRTGQDLLGAERAIGLDLDPVRVRRMARGAVLGRLIPGDHVGPLALGVGGLPTGVTLANATGTYQGGSYCDVLAADQPLAPGKSVMVTLDFSMSGRRSKSLSKLHEDLEALSGI